MVEASEEVRFDPLKVEVFHHLFAAAAEEMGVSLQRSAFSVNIKERLDFSCAIFTADGAMAAQAAHLPVHLGATPLSVAAAIARHRLAPGDVVFLNDPFDGGTHLPDITSVEGVFDPDAMNAGEDPEPLFYCVSRAHHADVGGAFPGSMAPARDVHGEGLRMPPVKLVRRGTIDQDLLEMFLANVRVPAERRADLLAQLAASRAGVVRLRAMMREHGAAELTARARDLVAWTASLTKDRIASLKPGTWRFEDVLEGGADGRGELLPLRLALLSDGERLVFDFRDSAAQAMDGAPVNTTRAVTVSAVFYCLRLLLPEGTPTNAGILERVEILTTPGTVVDAAYPAAVAAGNVETSQRLVDVILGAMARMLPLDVPAASAGTMNNLSFGGTTASGRSFTHYETHGGGAGAGPRFAGAHAVQTHMTNTRNTPIEALETEMPVRVLSQTVRRDSGGKGARAGGDGIVRRLRFLVDVRLAWMGERQRQAPYGLQGGQRGSLGTASVQPPGEPARTLDPKAALDLPAGAEFEVRTPGGGGHGDLPPV
ncbi:Acetophenone carboxylase delta subunit [Planctomycetes bacterium Poly30]|uniref:Acetophenone carboxylase delta subunit n=1 Tax=Saltatorellus ferox TaxID=2528018 RepID=A0A518ER52_9BACT|nr:Acetophenone carboxylase delta subunit [Planctomycetes bacterium Poly30]